MIRVAEKPKPASKANKSKSKTKCSALHFPQAITDPDWVQAITDLDPMPYAGKANGYHKDLMGMQRKALGFANLAGWALRAAKARVPPGEWKAWVEANFVASYETAAAYMRISKNWHLFDARYEKENFSLNEALAMLRVPREATEPREATALQLGKREVEQWFHLLLEDWTMAEVAHLQTNWRDLADLVDGYREGIRTQIK